MLKKLLKTISMLSISFASFSPVILAADAKMDAKELADLVALIDERQRSTGDYESEVAMKETEGKTQKAFEAVVYRRDADQKWMILFNKPKSESGKGYLRIDKNLFMYEPTLGKWERNTERSSIVGTGSQRSDFDAPKLTQEFVAEFVGLEKLGKFSVHHLKLKAKPGVEVGYPIQDMWVDVASKNVLKREDRATSEKLMRTVYYPAWDKVYSQSKKADVYVPKEIRIYDEVEKGNSTIIEIRKVKLESLPVNIFTKAWIESKSK